MAQKSVGVDVLSGLFCRGRCHSRQPICAAPAGESWVHPHPDVRRESVLRYDPDRDGGAGSLVRKEESRARFAESPTRNENGLEPNWTSEARPCLDVKLATADQRRGEPARSASALSGRARLKTAVNQIIRDDSQSNDNLAQARRAGA